MRGWERADGRKGIRNIVVVAYLVECAHHVSKQIAAPFEDDDVHVIGFPGCYPNAYAQRMLTALCTHPNVGAVLLVSLGCEGFNKGALENEIRESGRPMALATIQHDGGSIETINAGRAQVAKMCEALKLQPTVELVPGDLVVGTICGGSDGTSALTANPAIGRAFDTLVNAGTTCIFEETGELIGCENHMAERAVTPELGEAIVACIAKAAKYYTELGHGSFAPGNADGGLTTQEEKSLGAYSKSGSAPISGLIKPADRPLVPGLYLLDVVPDGEVRFGFPNINDVVEIAELIACGAHVILFSTGRGSVVGSAIAPVVKICANPETFRKMPGDMDIDAGKILEGHESLDKLGEEIVALVHEVASGRRTVSEALGHREFGLTYKTFEPTGPSCLPAPPR